ncbi:MAG: SHOCT domain-containing protein, partial [Candidatus Micrarchaeaceae archaeon]
KLKTLMDSGVISKEDFEAQKNKLLRGMSSSDSVEEKLKKLKSLLDSGAITQEEYERQKKAVLENIWR